METVGRSSAALSNANESNDALVVALVRGDSVYCTGTLIAPRAVVTAAHCVEEGPITVAFGAVIDASSRRVKAQRIHASPSYDPATLAHDVAILALAEPTDGAFASIDRETPLAAGEVLRSVGYGSTSGTAKDFGHQRAGSVTVFASPDEHVELRPGPAMLCAGDSGGPSFDASGALVAITSYGEETCMVNAFATRVDAERTFIRDTVAGIAAEDAPKDDGGCAAGGRGAVDSSVAVAIAVALLGVLAIRRAIPRTSRGPSAAALR